MQQLERRSERRYWRLTLAAVALYVVVFSAFTIGRYDRYNATGFDLAFYDQILWRTAHGDIMGLSVEGDNFSNWAFHVEPILLLIAPVKLILTDVRWLLILQTITLAVAAIPVYWIAKRLWQKPSIGFLFALLYLLYPTVSWANKFDIHPLTIATPLLLFAWDAAEHGRFRLVSVLLLLALMCKEEMGFVVACFGLYWFFAPQRWRTGLIWAGLGIGWTLIGFFVIIPGAQGKSVLPNQAFLRYAWLFQKSAISDKLAFVLNPTSPFRIDVKIRFFIQLLTPLAFLPLLKPRVLAIAIPILGLSFLSTNMNQSSIYHHYMANVIPFLMIAAIQGSYAAKQYARKLRMRPAFMQRLVFTAMTAATVLMFVIFNPFTFIPREPYAPIYGWEPGASLDGLQAASALIPPDSCLTTSNNIAAHYGARTYLYVIGIGNYLDCNLIMVDLADMRYISFGVPQQFACQQYADNKFQPIFYQDNVVILKQNAPPSTDMDARLTAFCAAFAKQT